MNDATTTHGPTAEQDRRWAEAGARYGARFGTDGWKVLDAHVRERQRVATMGLSTRGRANARRWLRTVGAAEPGR